MVQAAVNRLEREAAPAHSQGMLKSRPSSQFSLGWPAWHCNRHVYTVHEVPDVMWRHTHSSSDGSESAPGGWSDLADAALVLLENPTLAGVICPQQQQQHHTKVGLVVPSRQGPKYGPSAAGDWESFVQECLAPKSGAATAGLVSRLEVSASLLAAWQTHLTLIVLPGIHDILHTLRAGVHSCRNANKAMLAVTVCV
jgi:hypothetical protein